MGNVLSIKEIDEIVEKELEDYWQEIKKRLKWDSVSRGDLTKREKGFKDSMRNIVRGRAIIFRHDKEKMINHFKNLKKQKLDEAEKKIKSMSPNEMKGILKRAIKRGKK